MFRHYPHNSLHEAANRLARIYARDDEYDRVEDLKRAVFEIVRGLETLKDAARKLPKVETFIRETAAGLHDAVNDIAGDIAHDLDEVTLVPEYKVDLSEVEALMKEGE